MRLHRTRATLEVMDHHHRTLRKATHLRHTAIQDSNLRRLIRAELLAESLPAAPTVRMVITGLPEVLEGDSRPFNRTPDIRFNLPKDSLVLL